MALNERFWLSVKYGPFIVVFLLCVKKKLGLRFCLILISLPQSLMFLSYFTANVLVLVYSNCNSPFCKSVFWGRKQTLFGNTRTLSYLYLLEVNVVNPYDQSHSSFWSYFTLSVMAGASYVFSAALVNLGLMNICFKITYFIFNFFLYHKTWAGISV